MIISVVNGNKQRNTIIKYTTRLNTSGKRKSDTNHKAKLVHASHWVIGLFGFSDRDCSLFVEIDLSPQHTFKPVALPRARCNGNTIRASLTVAVVICMRCAFSSIYGRMSSVRVYLTGRNGSTCLACQISVLWCKLHASTLPLKMPKQYEAQPLSCSKRRFDKRPTSRIQ